MPETTPSEYMLLALQLAERGRLTVSPNPLVGCVIVKEGHIVGQGYHQRAGEAHAEIHALEAAGLEAKDATMYVTLEPCCHHGRTPPCTEAIIKAGIKKVFIACTDPNPQVAGLGIEALITAGIEVEIGLKKEKALVLNEVFFHFITHKRPFVIAKWAMSLDGKTVTHPEDARSISSHQSQIDAHELRQQVDAILIGAATARHDNPQLTVRLAKYVQKHPIRIILSTDGRLSPNLEIFKPTLPGKTILVTSDQVDTTAFANCSVEILTLPANKEGRIDLQKLLDKLGEMQITSLLVEGGMRVHEQLFAANLVNKVSVYIAPVIIGTMQKKQAVHIQHYEQLASDIHILASCEEQTHV